ncbi:hypothetical protein D3C87_1594240 [compost metagenome]
MSDGADDGGRQEGEQHRDDEAAGLDARRQRQRDRQKPLEIDEQDRQDGAELNENGKGVARRPEAEEVPGEEHMRRRRHRNELREPLDEAEDERADDRLIRHI